MRHLKGSVGLKTLALFSFVLLFARVNGQTKPLTMEQVWKMDATYKDAQHGVSFRYPSVWKPTTEFAYHPSSLTLSDDLKPIAGFGYSEGGFPRQSVVGPYSGTDLEGFDIVYTAVPAKSEAECEAKAASVAAKPDAGTVVLGGRTFSVRETGDGGMSQYTGGNLYATYAGATCYLFETDTAIVMPGVADGSVPLTKAQSDKIIARLLEIMKSVRVAPRN